MRAETLFDRRDPFDGLAALGDDDLLHRLGEVVGRSRRVEAEIVAHIAEVDERRLYAREACPSMFAYCTEVLHLSEAEAYLRITAARAARLHPVLLTMLADGRLHLRAITTLAPCLTAANHETVLAQATHKSKRQIEELVAALAPRPDAPAVIRKLPALGAAQPTVPPSSEPLRLCPDRVPVMLSPPRAATVQPTAPERYRVQFTATAELRAKLDRLVALMRHRIPDGDLAAVLDDAITEKLARLQARRFAKSTARKALDAADTSASGSRYIPAPVRRLVDQRDGGRCRYVGADGRRCSERARLEFHHHLRPHARGGDRSPDNIRLMCRTHNVYQAESDFGREAMARFRRPAAPTRPPP